MGVLSGKQINQFVNDNKLHVIPFSPEQIQPASYDLRIGNRILASPCGPTELGKVVILSKDKPAYDIKSGQMVSVISLEKIELPLDLCGSFGIRSSFARLGINSFGGIQLDPGFRGHLIMNLLNVGPEPVTVHQGDIIFTIIFQRLDEIADVPYSGPYQDQDDFPQDQYDYILNAHTTSLAEIPSLRLEMSQLRGTIGELEEELEELLIDPDKGLEIKPEIREQLKRKLNLPRDKFLSYNEFKCRLESN